MNHLLYFNCDSGLILDLKRIQACLKLFCRKQSFNRTKGAQWSLIQPIFEHLLQNQQKVERISVTQSSKNCSNQLLY